MESSDRLTLQNGEVVAALESVRALESLLDALAAKVDDLEKRLGEAEERLEEIAIVYEQD
jgi:hypothetical protein